MLKRLQRLSQVLVNRLPDYMTHDPRIADPSFPHQRTGADRAEQLRKESAATYAGQIIVQPQSPENDN